MTLSIVWLPHCCQWHGTWILYKKKSGGGGLLAHWHLQKTSEDNDHNVHNHHQTMVVTSPPKRGIITNHTATTAKKKKVKHDWTRGNESYLIICIPLRHVTLLFSTHCYESSYICSDGGTDFSQGQWQLIAMACALVWRSSIIVLDQATST